MADVVNELVKNSKALGEEVVQGNSLDKPKILQKESVVAGRELLEEGIAFYFERSKFEVHL